MMMVGLCVDELVSNHTMLNDEGALCDDELESHHTVPDDEGALCDAEFASNHKIANDDGALCHDELDSNHTMPRNAGALCHDELDGNETVADTPARKIVGSIALGMRQLRAGSSYSKVSKAGPVAGLKEDRAKTWFLTQARRTPKDQTMQAELDQACRGSSPISLTNACTRPYILNTLLRRPGRT